MKKIIPFSAFLCFIFITMLVSSCKDAKTIFTSKVWTIEKLFTTSEIPGVIEAIDNYSKMYIDAKVTLQFKNDGTYILTMGGLSDTGTWSVSEDEKILTMKDKDSQIGEKSEIKIISTEAIVLVDTDELEYLENNEKKVEKDVKIISSWK